MFATMYVIGITGGICSGKSTISQILASLGVAVIDADKLGHRAYEQSTQCYSCLVSHFGPRIVGQDNSIDRKALGSIVFADKNEMQELQRIVWPEIKRLIVDILSDFSVNKPNLVIALEAAIMIEAGWQDLVHAMWVCSVETATAIERLTKRNSLTRIDAEMRINSQLSNEERLKFADAVIDNNSVDESALQAQVMQLCANNSNLQHLLSPPPQSEPDSFH